MSNNDYNILSAFSEELEQKVIDANSPSDSYVICFRNKEANWQKHQEIVIRNKSAKYAFYFAKDIVGADKEKLKQVIVEQKSTYWVSQYYRYVDQDIIDMVFETKDNEYINGCVIDISNRE